MKKSIIIVAVILGVLQFNGCNLVTAYNRYGFYEYNPSCEKQDGFYLRPDIKSDLENWVIIPGLYDIDLYDGPYHYYFSIGGDFDRLISVHSRFVVNNERIIEVPLSVERMNSQRNVHWTGSISFPDGEHLLPIDWELVDTLTIKTEFIGEKNGVQVAYSVVNEFKKRHEIRHSNRFVDYIAYF